MSNQVMHLDHARRRMLPWYILTAVWQRLHSSWLGEHEQQVCMRHPLSLCTLQCCTFAAHF